MTSEHQTGHRSADDLVVGLTGARFGGTAGRRRRAADPPPAEDDTGAAHHRREEQPLVGQTGARFSAVSRRWRRRQDSSDRQDAGLPDPEQPANTSGVTDPPRGEGPVAHPSTAPSAARPPEAGAAEPVDWAEGSEWADWDAVTEPGGMVRPYSWTGGRTTPRVELPVEALVSLTGQPLEPTAPPEHSAIMTLCDAPRSVAEFAARLSIPLGVARIVLGDMAEAGTIVVHRTAGSADATPDLNLMRRVLHGLQRL